MDILAVGLRPVGTGALVARAERGGIGADAIGTPVEFPIDVKYSR